MKKIVSLMLVLVLVISFVPEALGAAVGDREAVSESYTGGVADSTDLLFEFDNREKDQERYKGSAYGGLNYDQETNGYWATAYNGSYTAYSIVNSGGTLRVHVTDGKDNGGTYGPWIKITNTHGKAPSYNANSYDLYPLNFDPSGVKTVTIRFKPVNCTVPEGKIPEIIFEYYYMMNGSYGYGNDMKAVYTFRNQEYMIVSIPVSSKLTKADVLKGFGFRFRNIKGGSNARIYIDYMYIGASSSFVMGNHEDKTFLSQSTIPVTSGVSRSQFVLKNTTDYLPVTGYMATVAPSAKVTFKASYAGYYTEGSTEESRSADCMTMDFGRMVATDHAAAYEATTGEKVLMVTNGNFFNTETFQPRGCLVLEGNIVQTYSVHYGAPYFAVLEDGSFAIRPFGHPLTDVKEAVSGYQWLVRDGELITTNDDETLAPRTAIGLKEDGTVVWVTVDGRQEGYSMGLTIHEMGELMYAAGCVNAMNMDGGGSTTMAARYNNTGDLLLQNSPSDEGGARLLPTCLLMVGEACDHKLTGQPYTVYPDGTHSQDCASCGEVIRVGHMYEEGVCICGDLRHFDGGLFFDFTNTHEDKYRYMDPVYQYRNFDMASDGTWGRGYWATGYTDTTSDFTIDNEAGTLNLKVGQGYSGSAGDEVYGPWLKLTSAYGKAPTKTDSRFGTLSYDPAKVEYVEIRFKVENCEIPAGKTPELYFEYYYEKDGVYQGATDIYTAYTYTPREYVTVTLPATDNLRQAQELQAFGFRFCNIKGGSTGRITIDYIRVVEGAKEPAVDATLKLNHSLNLASDISVNFALPVNVLEGFDMDTVYVECRYTEENGEDRLCRILPEKKELYYYFTLEGLTAVHMTTVLTSVLHGTKNGRSYISPTDVYSIADYAYSQLGKTGILENLKSLCAELLRYGSKAQLFKGYRTDSLPDANMTEAQKEYLSDMELVAFGNTNRVIDDLDNAPVTWAGKALNLESKVALMFVFHPGDYAGDLSELTLRISYADIHGETREATVGNPQVYNEAMGLYVFVVDCLLAAELRTVVSARIYGGEFPVSATLQYSADTYGNNKNGALLELCKALFAYSDSAKRYFAN